MAVKVKTPRIILLWLGIFVFALASTAQAEGPTFDDSTIPGDVAAYIELKDLGRLRQPDQRNALVETLLEHFTGSAEEGGTELARIISKEMKLTPDQLFEAYLSKRVVMVVGPGKEAPVMLFMQVTPADVRRVIQYFELTERWQVGPWKAYLSYDKQTLVGLSSDSLFLCNVADEAYAKQVVTERTQKDSLASNANYQKWLKRLPERDARVAIGYGQAPDAFHYAWQVSITKHKVEADAVASQPTEKTFLPRNFQPDAATLALLPDDAAITMCAGGTTAHDQAIASLTKLLPGNTKPQSKMAGVVAWAGYHQKAEADAWQWGAAIQMPSEDAAQQLANTIQQLWLLGGISQTDQANKPQIKPHRYQSFQFTSIKGDFLPASPTKGFESIGKLTFTCGQVGQTVLLTLSPEQHQSAIDRYLAFEDKDRDRLQTTKPNTTMLVMTSHDQPFINLLAVWREQLQTLTKEENIGQHEKARLKMAHDLLTKLGSFDLSLDSKKWAEEQGLSLHVTLGDREKPVQTEDSR